MGAYRIGPSRPRPLDHAVAAQPGHLGVPDEDLDLRRAILAHQRRALEGALTASDERDALAGEHAEVAVAAGVGDHVGRQVIVAGRFALERLDPTREHDAER